MFPACFCGQLVVNSVAQSVILKSPPYLATKRSTWYDRSEGTCRKRSLTSNEVAPQTDKIYLACRSVLTRRMKWVRLNN
jgi:hypothetical protein